MATRHTLAMVSTNIVSIAASISNGINIATTTVHISNPAKQVTITSSKSFLFIFIFIFICFHVKNLAPSTGFEPASYVLEARCLIRLDQLGILFILQLKK